MDFFRRELGSSNELTRVRMPSTGVGPDRMPLSPRSLVLITNTPACHNTFYDASGADSIESADHAHAYHGDVRF
ncbi:hypothetical protein CIT26_05935 [Mesorhizobium temperatum]|uniref:Uncharacterized protein n=1 Tax=Mesorhizobium temperatum TaxID=241416 RepID=A0A271LUW1_9HYPH|nr:hypothetical protein CIT26_05935 [Mesorhizobium temperatum]